MAFNTFNVCINNRETLLVIKREQFEEKNGTYNFNFRSNGQTFSLQIRFGKLTSWKRIAFFIFFMWVAPTGVYPLYPTVHVNEGDDYAKLTWLIFDSNVPITIRSFQGGTLLTDGISSEVDGITVAEGNDCISTVTGESTTVWNVFIDKPNSSTEGDYILVVINSEGQSSATVQLIGMIYELWEYRLFEIAIIFYSWFHISIYYNKDDTKYEFSSQHFWIIHWLTY